MTPGDVARAWAASPLAPPDAVRVFVRATREAFATLPPVRFVDADPFASLPLTEAARLVRDIGADTLPVWTGASGGLPWGPVDNWRMRAVHDRLDHCGRGSDAVPFTLEGEREACRRACARLPGLAPLLCSEILGQAAFATAYGAFPVQSVRWFDPRLAGL